jgi:outer membrane biosynthesis protein TonB
MKTTVRFSTFCWRACVVLGLVMMGRPAIAFDDPPMRVARLNYMAGRVSFQPGGETDWGWASLNRPMTGGDSLWTGRSSRAEMHIGSTAIRLSGQTAVSFLNLDDRMVQIELNTGTINVRVRNLYDGDVFEVDTPNLAFTLLRRGDYRITVDPEGSFTTITIRDGKGQITGGGQAFLVDSGSQVQVSGTDYISYETYDLPGRDRFDQWSRSRELREERIQSARYVSPELTGYEDLDRNGSWRTDSTYGPVWVPTRVPRGWAPYRNGHWAWVEPWGWTWVDNAPAGFVTSHYGRWAHVDNRHGSGGWVWVPPHREARQDIAEQRPVYSPALVTFVGNSTSSRDSGNAGRVGWFPLAPGEVYVPAQQASPAYVTKVNVTNTAVQQTTITNIVNNNVQTTTYVNQRVAGAVTAVPQATFVNAQPVAQAAVKVTASAAAPVVHTAPVVPVKASVMGTSGASMAKTAGLSAPPKPPAAIASRPVVARVTPPPAPVAFAQKQQALQANPGKPLDAQVEQNLRAATPPPVARIVKSAPPAPTVKPAETASKKPQPATSPNTAQQVHPPAPGAAPPTAAGSATRQQAAQQQAAAEKAKQEAAQQQAAQQAAADKAKQQAAQQQAAAEKAKQEAAQQQAADRRQRQPAAERPPSNTRPPSEVPAANQRATANGPVRVAGNVQAAKLVSQPKLNSPQDAKGAHIKGSVRVQALIGTDGTVKNATVLAGPQPLQKAAIENVRQRKYQPTIAGGKPVEVETEILIEF